MTHDGDSTDHVTAETDAISEPVRSDWSEYDSPCAAIVETVEAATGRVHTSLPPLFEAIDTDALEAIVSPTPTGVDGAVQISFEYAGTAVTVSSEGEIVVREDGVHPHDGPSQPQTEEDLNDLFSRSLSTASRNGVSVLGGWAVRNGSGLPDWDIHITRVEKPDSDARD